MKKAFILLVFICSNILFPQLTVSESEKKIITAGYGETPENALKDAFRNAVEEAVGLFCQSTTMMENQELLEDKIYTYSNGFIKNYKNLGTLKTEDGFFQTNIVAIITKNQVREAISGAGISIDIEEQAGLLFAQFSSEKQRFEDEEKAMETFLNNLKMIDPFDYKSHLVGLREHYYFVSGQRTTIQDFKTITQIVTVIPNDNYKNYFTTLNQFLNEIADIIVEDEFVFTGQGNNWYAISEQGEQKINSLPGIDNGRHNLFFMIEAVNEKVSQSTGSPKKKKQKKGWNKRWKKFQQVGRKYHNPVKEIGKPFSAKGKLYNFVSGKTFQLLSDHLMNFQEMDFQIIFKDNDGNVFKTITFVDFNMAVLEGPSMDEGSNETVRNWRKINVPSPKFSESYFQMHPHTGNKEIRSSGRYFNYKTGLIFNASNLGWKNLAGSTNSSIRTKRNKRKQYNNVYRNQRKLYSHNTATNLINSRFMGFPMLQDEDWFGYSYNSDKRMKFKFTDYWDLDKNQFTFLASFFFHPKVFRIDYDSHFKKMRERNEKEYGSLFEDQNLTDQFFKLEREESAISLFGVENRLSLEEIGKVAKIEIVPLKNESWLKDQLLELGKTP